MSLTLRSICSAISSDNGWLGGFQKHSSQPHQGANHLNRSAAQIVRNSSLLPHSHRGNGPSPPLPASSAIRPEDCRPQEIFWARWKSAKVSILLGCSGSIFDGAHGLGWCLHGSGPQHAVVRGLLVLYHCSLCRKVPLGLWAEFWMHLMASPEGRGPGKLLGSQVRLHAWVLLFSSLAHASADCFLRHWPFSFFKIPIR